MRALLALVLLATGPALAQSPKVTVCWDFGCTTQRSVELPPTDWAAIQAVFSPQPQNAAEERRQIATAIARFETVTGKLLGTAADLGGNRAGSGQPFQMDCIDESRNTDSYLRALAAAGLLRWHSVAERRKRAPWLLDQHWTAVVRDSSGSEWAVDSWFLDNGRRPYVQQLEDWFSKEELPFNPDALADAS